MSRHRHTAVLTALALLTACGKEPETTQNETRYLRVSTAVVAEADWGSTETVLGQIESPQPARVGAEVEGGIITRVRVDVGDRVRRGDPLVDIDDTVLRESVREANAARRAAESVFSGLEVELERSRSALSGGGVSASEVDNLRSRRDEALQRVNQAAATETAARERMRRSTVVAPIDGVVLRRSVEVGDRLSSGGVAFEIGAEGDAVFVGTASISQLAAFEVGAQAVVHPQGSAAPIAGRVVHVAPGYGTGQSAGVVRVALADARVAPGTPSRAAIQTGQSSGIVVPNAAVQFLDTPTVWVIDEQNRAVRRTVVVDTGPPSGFRVSSGLRPGETIILEAGALLTEGETVVASEASRTSPGARLR